MDNKERQDCEVDGGTRYRMNCWYKGKKKGEDQERNAIIKVLNVQGLTKTKGKEVEELVSGNSIVCLTETQKKVKGCKL